MKPTTLYIFTLMLAACLAACTADDLPGGTTVPGSGTLRIAYRVAGNSVQTKADNTEAGVDALNENTVTRLDFFAFKSDGSLLCPVISFTQGTFYSATYAPLTISEDQLSLEAVQDNTDGSYYLVANCPSVANITTLSDLQAALTSGTGNPALITTDGTVPTAFIMDAKATPATSGKDITLSFDLRRAAAKIRIRVTGGTPKTFQFFHYADDAYVISSETPYPDELQSTAETTITDNIPLRDGDGYVFYSYPNDWFNSTLYTQEENGNYTCNDEGLHNGEPIVAAKQTYLLLQATYDNKEYYYKIPVNRRLPDFNDNPSFTEDEYEQIHDLYRLKRNHLYDVAVTISGPGGTMDDPVVPAYTITINDWVNGHPDGDDGRYELPPDAFVEPSTSNVSPCHPERRRQPQSKDLTYRAALSALNGRCFTDVQHDRANEFLNS